MSSAKKPANNFANALRVARKLQGVSQENFSLVSSRTYVSSIERGVRVPTLNKVDELASVLGVHPLTLLFLAYAPDLSPGSIEKLQSLISIEIMSLGDVGS